MRVRRFTRLGVAGVAVAATILVGGTAASAGADSGNGRFRPPRDCLRALAAPIGLRIGTAVTPFELDNDAYRQITGDQFSTVTPGNEMKRQIVEPTQGTYGKIWQWDVANEFFTDSNPSGINPNDFWVSHLGTGIIADAFRWAHQADPYGCWWPAWPCASASPSPRGASATPTPGSRASSRVRGTPPSTTST